MKQRQARTKWMIAVAVIAAPFVATAQDGVSTAGAARASYLSSLGVIPRSSEIAVEDFINYHRHEIGRPKAGEAVGLDFRWSSDVASEGSVFLQVGLSTALLNDRSDRRPINLALVIDKSGSMAGSDKMSRVIAALQTLVTKLNETDVLSIVVYDTQAHVLLPATRLTNKHAVKNTIRNIRPRGSTNVEAGLSLGYEEVLKHYQEGGTNRVLLLTDGIANKGVTDPEEIASGSAAYNRRGIDLTTIGVGRDLNHDLLDTLAKSGRGLFHFVADAKDIEKVFDKEVQSLLSPVATAPKIEIRFPTSVFVEKVYGYDANTHDNKVTVELDNMNNGMTEVVIVKFRPVVERDFGASPEIWLSYYDIERGRKVTGIERTFVSFPTGGVEDRSVTKNATIATLAQAIHDMAKSCESGDTTKAERTIGKAITDARINYPNMEDEDVKRTLDTALRYQQVLRKEYKHPEQEDQAAVEVRPTRTAPNLLPNGSFTLGNSGFSSALKYTPPGKNCLWPMGYTIAPKWNDPLLHRLHITSQEFLAPKRPTGKEQVFFANAGGTESLVLFTCIVGLKPNTNYRISFQSVSLNAGREWIPTYEIRIGGERSQPQPAGYGQYEETSMIWNSGPTSSATLSIVRMPIPHGGGLIAIANIEMVEID